MRRSDYEDEEPEELFFDDDMMLAWTVYQAVSTQWRVGMNGATGIDYSVLPFLFDVYNVKDKEMTLNDLRVLECKALEMMQVRQK
ncbi:gp42 [Escherichia phage phiEB49]|uniref:Gp42 n=1 Tax=Escherichia phage phiEB49 TaxID=1048207 RepID=F8UBV2_9CAUD|nr:tail length tape measure protein [Escherichia phage phiEB49]AEI91242.1 gp42 [Escherichia phage phiEB49]